MVKAYGVWVEKDKDGKVTLKDAYSLQQIPNINGAIIAIDPHSGRVLAMVGGYTYGNSHFNRATQAHRQPGSAFKPFVYLAALENGFNASSVVNDGPIEIPQGPGLPTWTPKNYSGDFMGYIPLRKGLERSRNAVTILLALMLGVDKIQEVTKRLGIIDNPQPFYSMVLGAQETTLLRLTTAYAVIANGGKEVKPIFIDRIHDRTGKIIYRGDTRECDNCKNVSAITPPNILDNSKQLVNPISNYQLIDIMQGVVTRGTATKALVLGRPLAGKTGTTNDSYDNWFLGFTPDLVVGTYIGFDSPRTMGEGATGASTTLPVFVDFMKQALNDVPAKPVPLPDGAVFTKTDISTGMPATEDSHPENVRMEIINPNAPQIIYSQAYKEFIANKAETDPLGADGDIDSGGIY
jgi:penicillin-binding protein 1A